MLLVCVFPQKTFVKCSVLLLTHLKIDHGGLDDAESVCFPAYMAS